MRNTVHMFQDLFTRIYPARKNDDSYKFAFLVHPRSHHDLRRKYPYFKYIPRFLAHVFTKYFWPVTLSKITGLKARVDGKPVEGYVIAVLMTARQMVEDREKALKKITQACILAQNKGAKIIGLGGLTSSFSKGGLDLIDKVDLNITTGHAYTSHNVTQNVFKLAEYMEVDKRQVQIAIVGAAGSVGSTCAKLIARNGFKNLTLIDLERKKHYFEDLVSEIKLLSSDVNIKLSHQIGDIKDCDIIVAATNAPEALIKSIDLKPGAIIVDDAQPSDVHPDVLDREDVLVIEAGVTHTPGIVNNFNFGLKDRQDNFCCLAEVLILASNKWDEHYVINRASLELVDEIAKLGDELKFTIGKFQNFKETIPDEKLLRIKDIIKKNELQY